MAFEWLYRSRYPKIARRRKRLVWRVPEPQHVTGDGVLSYTFPTISKRRLRYLGRREVYPHSLHVHLTTMHRIEEP